MALKLVVTCTNDASSVAGKAAYVCNCRIPDGTAGFTAAIPFESLFFMSLQHEHFIVEIGSRDADALLKAIPQIIKGKPNPKQGFRIIMA